MSDAPKPRTLEEIALAFWNDSRACPSDDHGGREGANYYRSGCAYCLADLLGEAADAERAFLRGKVQALTYNDGFVDAEDLLNWLDSRKDQA